jgi:hypothetical protein
MRRAEIVSYGGGTNSAALLVGLHEHGERPDAIVFADTGGEKPHTYGHLFTMQPWCERIGFPSITIVRGEQRQQEIDGSLEGECLRLGKLPAKALGFGDCSDKWKRDPMQKWVKRNCPEGLVTLIGYHAGEAERVRRSSIYAEEKRYPLIEWDWDYEDCEAAILRAGLPLPGKSACYFCPSSKAREILELRDRYPDLMARALEMERRALAGDGQAPALHTIKGLGRRFAWAQLLKEHDAQPDLFTLTPETCSEACFT